MTRCPLIILTVLSLGGCAALRPSESVETMRLSPSFPPTTAMRDASVIRLPVEAAGMTADRRYVYVMSTQPLVLHQAATLFWEVSPTLTVDHALDAALRTDITDRPGADSLGRLGTRLTRFEEVSSTDRADALVEVDALLIDEARQTRSGGVYCRSTPIGQGTGARALAFQISVGAVAKALAEDVAKGRLAPSSC